MRIVHWGLGVLSAFALCSLFIEGHASAQNATYFATPGPAVPAMPANPAPTLPAGCAAPTLADCQTARWFLTNQCASSKDMVPAPAPKLGAPIVPAQSKQQTVIGYCRWLMQEEWRKGTGATHNTYFPTAQPVTVETPLTPGRKIDRGRNVDASFVAGKPTERRSFKSAAPSGNYKALAKPSTLEWSPKRGVSTGGSWTSQTVAAAAPITAQSNASMEVFRTTGLQLATVNTQANTLMATLIAPIAQVSPGPQVGDCFEYANKHWGDYTRFAAAAKRLGRNYRQVYNLAMTPSSPVFINKEPLVQTGTNIPMEKQLRDVMPGTHNGNNQTADLYANAFQVEKVDWIDGYNIAGLGPAEKATIKNMVNARLAAGTVIHGTSGTPLSVHENAKQRLDTAYGSPNDDELEDAAKRAAAYQKLWVQRAFVVEELECASGSDPCHLCTSPPNPGSNQLPGGIQKLKERISGAPVINPADINVLMEVGNPAQRFRSLAVMNSVAPAMAGVAVGQRGNSSQIEQQLKSQGKLKVAPPLAQIQGGNTPGGGAMAPPKFGPGINACAAALQSKRPQLQIALIYNERKMAALLLNEMKVGDRGCLGNPGPNKTNLCDWNYELFGSTMATLMDSMVEASFEECRVEVANAAPVSGLGLMTNYFSAILKEPKRQGLVFPCVWREDFTVNAAKAKEFMVLNGDPIGRRCEGQFQKGMQVELEAGITGALAGIEWTPGEEKIGDTENDSMTLGDAATLGAYATYSTGWSVKSAGKKPNGNNMDTCKFDGAANSTIDVGVNFFNTDIKILTLEGKGDTKTRTASLKARYRDFDTGILTYFNDTTHGQSVNYGANDGLSIPPISPPIYLGGDEISFWVWIGPVPVRIAFGAFASAGINYNFTGVSGENCSSNGLKGASNFKMGSTLEPYARGDAYASASVDILVAEAGVRLDLLLLRVGLPIGLNIDNSTNDSWKFDNGARISIDLLSGKLSAYAEAGVPPLEASWEETLFRWDGFHTDVPVFSLPGKTIGNDVMRIALAKAIDPEKAKCKCQLGSGNTKGFCCSDFSCPSGQTCASKTIDGQAYVCNFTHVVNYSNCDKYIHGVPQ